MKKDINDKVYSNEEKIEFYEKQLEIVIGSLMANKNTFERMYHSERLNFIIMKLKKLLRETED